MTETLDLIGKLITDPTAGRDCVHMAVMPAVAGEELRPGDHIGIDRRDGKTAIRGSNTLGIVDPFLRKDVVHVGESFFLFVYPRTITGLRHVWTHPAFVSRPPEPELVEAANAE